MAKRLTSEEAYQRAECIRADWESGRYESQSALAREYELTMQYVRNIILGVKCVRRSVEGKETIDWKRITINEVHYAVFRDGRVWSFSLNRFLDFGVCDEGYRSFMTKRPDGGRKRIRVHRLVLTVWKRPPKPGEIARHKNDDTANNHIDNLKWGYQQDNSDDRRANGGLRVGSEVSTSKLTEKQVKKFYKGFKGQCSKTEYVRDCKERDNLNISEGNLLGILSGLYWNHVTKHPRKTTLKISDKVVRNVRSNYEIFKGKQKLKDFCLGYSEFLATQGESIGWQTVRKIIKGELMQHVKP